MCRTEEAGESETTWTSSLGLAENSPRELRVVPRDWPRLGLALCDRHSSVLLLHHHHHYHLLRPKKPPLTITPLSQPPHTFTHRRPISLLIQLSRYHTPLCSLPDLRCTPPHTLSDRLEATYQPSLRTSHPLPDNLPSSASAISSCSLLAHFPDHNPLYTCFIPFLPLTICVRPLFSHLIGLLAGPSYHRHEGESAAGLMA